MAKYEYSRPKYSEVAPKALPVAPPPPAILTPTLAQRIGNVLGFNSSAQRHIRETLHIYESCVSAAETHLPWAYSTVGLPDTFQTWFGFVQLHVWMVMVRLRAEGPQSKQVLEGLISHFFRDMEERMWATGVCVYNFNIGIYISESNNSTTIQYHFLNNRSMLNITLPNIRTSGLMESMLMDILEK
jgi:hypothetical protein